MIGPFSTTVVPLSSSSSVDRQVLINVEASAISPDERTFGFIFTKIPVHKVFGWRKKRIKELGPDRPYFQFVAPPQKMFSTSRHWSTVLVNVKQSANGMSLWSQMKWFKKTHRPLLFKAVGMLSSIVQRNSLTGQIVANLSYPTDLYWQTRFTYRWLMIDKHLFGYFSSN